MRAVVAVIALALVATLTALDAATVSASALNERIGSARRGQGYWESAMLQADRLVNRLDRGRDKVRRDVHRAERSLRKVKSRRESARQVMHSHADRVRDLEAKAPPEGEPLPDWIARKLRAAEAQLDRAQRTENRLDRMVSRVLRIRAAKLRKMRAFRGVLRGAVGRREAAEGALGGLIVSATHLAQQRAELKTYIRLGSEGSFVWPTSGRITQGYGCTGYAANPSRGSCRHFHDGLDISPSGGTRIGSVATGVVAYAGWNPWDAEGRAFIVVLGHADGYVSRYGHLVPNRRVVRAGQVLYRGQTVGYMGSTGNSTGVHLHIEVLRGGSTIDPTSVFPDRGDADKASKDKKGKGKAKKAKAKASRPKHKNDRRRGHDRDRDSGERADTDRSEASEAPIEAASGLTVDASLVADECDPPTEAPIANQRFRDPDAPPTLSDLAEQLRRRADRCAVPVEEPQDGSSWPGGTSPWDLSVLDGTEASAR